MRILQAFDFLSLPRGGGTVDIVYKLSKALAERGHDVTVCTGDYELDCDYLNTLGKVGLKLCRSYFNRHGLYLMPELLKLDIKDYDVIHLHCFRSIQNAILCRKAVRQGVPYVIDAHGSTVDLPGMKQVLRAGYDRLLGKFTVEHASCFIAETEVGVAEYEKLGINRDRIRLLHPLLDTSEFDNLPEYGLFREKHGLGHEFIVLFLGRVHRDKGIDLLVDALKYLHQRNVWLRLVIAGSDHGFALTLEETITRARIFSKVLFTGFLRGQDKLSALVDADVLVQPSRNEAGARPSLEALLCDTPVIVTRDTGAGREIAKFDGGSLFNYGDTSTLANILQSILDDPEPARVKTEQAKAYIKSNLSLDKRIGEYEKLYQEAVG